LGLNSWTSSVNNPTTSEGWAVFIELFFGPSNTTFLSKNDKYGNYIDPSGKPDPTAMVPLILGAGRVAARLAHDTGLHYSGRPETGAKDDPQFPYGMTMAKFFEVFRRDTFGNFDAESEIAQRIPVSPTQALNYALGFMQILNLFRQLENTIGTELFDELQANNNKAFKYFFDLLLIDAQGYFLSSLEDIFIDLGNKIKNGEPPFDDPNYDGYPVDAFSAQSVGYVPGEQPLLDLAYYNVDVNPYKTGGWDFIFPSDPVPFPGPIVEHDPADGATGVPTNQVLSWNRDSTTTSNDVYFGTVSPPPLVAPDLVPRMYDPGALSASTTYYWRVVGKNSAGKVNTEIMEPVLSFTTA
jgi:hypothetical protein